MDEPTSELQSYETILDVGETGSPVVRAQISDHLSVVRSLLFAIVFKGSALLRLYRLNELGVAEALKACWSKHLLLVRSRSKDGRNRRFDRVTRASDSDLIQAWGVVRKALGLGRIDGLDRVLSSRNLAAHVGFTDDDELLGLLGKVRRELLRMFTTIESGLTEEQRSHVGRFRITAGETVPVLRGVEFPPAWPHPRLEWWGWSQTMADRRHRVVTAGMPLFDLYFPSLGRARQYNKTWHDLPPSPTPHHARKAVVRELNEFWSSRYPSCIVLGIGGIGKTAETLHWAWDLMKREDAPRRIVFRSSKLTFFSELGLERSMDTVRRDTFDAVIAEVYSILCDEVDGVSVPEGEDLWTYLKSFESDYRTRLVVVDNCETIKLRPEEIVSRVRVLERHAKVVLTSRKRVYPTREVSIRELPDENSRRVLRDLVEREGWPEFEPDDIRSLVELSQGRPLLLHTAVRYARGQNEPKERVRTRLGELSVEGDRELAQFMADHEWGELDDDQKLLTYLLFRAVVASGPLSRPQLRSMLLAAREQISREWNLDTFIDLLNERLALYTVTEGSDGTLFTEPTWGLQSLLEGLTLDDPFQRRFNLCWQNWDQENGARRTSLAGSFLNYLERKLPEAEVLELGSQGSDPLVRVEHLAGRESASVPVRVYAAWQLLDMGELEVSERFIRSVENEDPGNTWGNAARGQLLVQLAMRETDRESVRELASEGWRKFEITSASPEERIFVDSARVRAVRELLDFHPGFLVGEPGQPDDLWIRRGAQEVNLLDATLELVQHTRKRISAVFEAEISKREVDTSLTELRQLEAELRAM